MKIFAILILSVLAMLKIPALEMSGSVAFTFGAFAFLGLMALVSICKNDSNIRIKKIKVFFLCVVPYLWAFLYSTICHGIQERSCLNMVYWLMSVFVAMSSVYFVKEKAPLYSWISYVVAFSLHIIILLGKNGFLSIDMLELHEISFALGMSFLFFTMNEGKKEWGKILITVLLIILAHKRIELFALVICLILLFITRHKRALEEKSYLIGMFGIILGYALFVYNGGFGVVMDLLGVDSLGRVDVYVAMIDSLNSDDLVRGKGLGWIIEHLIEVDNNWRGYSDLHNDVLKFFIELGVFGGTIFWFLWIIVVPINLIKESSHYQKLMLVFILYNVILFFTDNVIRYMLVNISFYQIVFMEVDQKTLNKRKNIICMKN